MKKLLALYLALLSTYSFAYVGDIPIGQSKNMGTKQTEAPNLMSKMDTKVRVYNDSSKPFNVQVYYITTNTFGNQLWDYANSWQPSKGYSIDMKNYHPEVVPAHSWIDIYSGDNSNLAMPSIKYNVYGGDVKSAVSFTFSNISSDPDNKNQPMQFYHGYDDNYTKMVRYNNGSGTRSYDVNSCTALVVTDTSAVVAANLNRDACDITKANQNDMFILY